jgi:hypothetical protein
VWTAHGLEGHLLFTQSGHIRWVDTTDVVVGAAVVDVPDDVELLSGSSVVDDDASVVDDAS